MDPITIILLIPGGLGGLCCLPVTATYLCSIPCFLFGAGPCGYPVGRILFEAICPSNSILTLFESCYQIFPCLGVAPTPTILDSLNICLGGIKGCLPCAFLNTAGTGMGSIFTTTLGACASWIPFSSSSLLGEACCTQPVAFYQQTCSAYSLGGFLSGLIGSFFGTCGSVLTAPATCINLLISQICGIPQQITGAAQSFAGAFCSLCTGQTLLSECLSYVSSPSALLSLWQQLTGFNLETCVCTEPTKLLNAITNSCKAATNPLPGG